MALSDIRGAIKAVLSAVAGIGVVTDYEPYVTREEDFKTFFVRDGVLNGWSITREATPEVNANTLENTSQHLVVIRGYYGVNSKAATEKTFQDLIETIRVPLRQAMRTLYGMVAVVFVDAPQVRIVEPRKYGEALVHYCEITQVVHELVAIG